MRAPLHDFFPIHASKWALLLPRRRGSHSRACRGDVSRKNVVNAIDPGGPFLAIPKHFGQIAPWHALLPADRGAWPPVASRDRTWSSRDQHVRGIKHGYKSCGYPPMYGEVKRSYASYETFFVLVNSWAIF